MRNTTYLAQADRIPQGDSELLQDFFKTTQYYNFIEWAQWHDLSRIADARGLPQNCKLMTMLIKRFRKGNLHKISLANKDLKLEWTTSLTREPLLHKSLDYEQSLFCWELRRANQNTQRKKNKKTIASLLFLLTRAKDQYFSHVFKISFDISVLFQEFNTLYELWC